MTIIPGTNREDGPCVVWIGTTIHGLDDVYGPFPNCTAAKAFIDEKIAEEWCSKENALVLMLDQTYIKADVLMQTGVPTYDNVIELADAMFPHGGTSTANEEGEVIIHTGLRISENPAVKEGVLERVYDDNANEIPVPEEWYEDIDASPPIVTLDLKSAVDACLDVANEIFPDGKLSPAGDVDKDLMSRFTTALRATGERLDVVVRDEIEAMPPTDKSVRYSDDVRLATWADLAASGMCKLQAEITEADMDAWWARKQTKETQ